MLWWMLWLMEIERLRSISWIDLYIFGSVLVDSIGWLVGWLVSWLVDWLVNILMKHYFIWICKFVQRERASVFQIPIYRIWVEQATWNDLTIQLVSITVQLNIVYIYIWLVKAKIKHSMQAAHAERRGQRGGGSWFTAKRNVKRYLFAAAATLALLLLLPGLNYVNCKASRSGIVHHSMQKSPKQSSSSGQSSRQSSGQQQR